VVGDSYAPPRRWGLTIARWGAAAALAAIMSWVIWSILDVHASRAKANAAAKRPTQVHILPPAPPGQAPAPMPAR